MSPRLNILVLSLFPIEAPRNGGEMRVRQIYNKYLDLGHNVLARGLGSFSPERQLPNGYLRPPDFEELSRILPDLAGMENFALGKLLATDDTWFYRLSRELPSEVDFVHIEHPWLYPFVERWARTLTEEPQIIYGAANIEYRVKSWLLNGLHPKEKKRKLVEAVRDLELHAIRNSAAVLCVSEEDARWAEESGARRVLIVPNGTIDVNPSPNELAWALDLQGSYRAALFVSSAYKPNVEGFFDMFAGGFGCLSPTERLIIAGGISAVGGFSERLAKIPGLSRRSILAGELEEWQPGALLASAHAIILPVTFGGGTNLKTAEALWSGKHVVATPTAMRGFERFIGAEGVLTAEQPDEFKRKIRQAMDSEPLNLGVSERERRQSLLWGACVGELEKLFATQGGS